MLRKLVTHWGDGLPIFSGWIIKVFMGAKFILDEAKFYK
jgi:hypothetical protein